MSRARDILSQIEVDSELTSDQIKNTLVKFTESSSISELTLLATDYPKYTTYLASEETMNIVESIMHKTIDGACNTILELQESTDNGKVREALDLIEYVTMNKAKKLIDRLDESTNVTENVTYSSYLESRQFNRKTYKSCAKQLQNEVDFNGTTAEFSMSAKTQTPQIWFDPDVFEENYDIILDVLEQFFSNVYAIESSSSDREGFEFRD